MWFQKFEYAISHWLQKTAEHVIGCVLCSPGCFSLFRAAALMDDNVMRRYATKSSEASHYVQYDQGTKTPSGRGGGEGSVGGALEKEEKKKIMNQQQEYW